MAGPKFDQTVLGMREGAQRSDLDDIPFGADVGCGATVTVPDTMRRLAPRLVEVGSATKTGGERNRISSESER